MVKNCPDSNNTSLRTPPFVSYVCGMLAKSLSMGVAVYNNGVPPSSSLAF